MKICFSSPTFTHLFSLFQAYQTIVVPNMHEFIKVSSILTKADFRLACRSPHCQFDGGFCTTAKALLTVEERPSSEQRQANQSITAPLCTQWQTAYSWLLFSLRVMSLGGKAKTAWPLRGAILRRQAVIRWWSSNVVNGSLLWNQLNKTVLHTGCLQMSGFLPNVAFFFLTKLTGWFSTDEYK